MIAWWVGAALAASPGYYHPDDIAAASKTFARASDATAGPFEVASRDAAVLGEALNDWEAALELLGDRAPVEQIERVQVVRKQYIRDRAVLEDFSGRMMDDFGAAFLSAMDRALAGHPGAVACEREIRSAVPMPGFRPKTSANPACVGADLNDALAAAMDKDAVLAAAVAEIAARPWPALHRPSEPSDPIGTGERTVQVLALAEAVRPSGLREIARRDADARDDFAASLEQDDSPANVAALQAESAALEAETAAARASLAEPLLVAADKAAAKWAKKGEAPFAWCAAPALLGGCGLPDATGELVDRLAESPKIARLAD